MQTIERSATPRQHPEGTQPLPSVRGLRVRTQIRVGPSNYYDQCETCKSNCNYKSPEFVESCKADCEANLCDYP